MQLRRVEVIGGGPAGLFAARLIKERIPHASVHVSERSVPDDTFGFGVAFTARTLRAVAEAERATFDRIVTASVPMPPQEMLIDGVSVRAKGNGGGIAIARSRLLAVLLDEAVRAGVEVDLGVERNLGDVRDADLVIAADGAGSRTRAELAEHVGGRVDPGRGVFMWLGCATRLRSNLFVPVRTEHGLFTIHGYPYAAELSTLGVEADAGTWRRAGMDTATERTPLTESDAFSLAYLQNAFGDALGGAELLGNRSRWMHFRTVSLPRWHYENVVLIGDAAHTAHYSVGSGTKMALEDAIVLADSLTTGEEPALAGALGSGAERGQDPAVRRDAAGIELVEVVHHGRVGLPVGRDGFGVADADPQQEAVAVPGGDSPVRRGDVRGVVGPHVDDRGGHRDRGRGVQDALRQGEITDRRAAEPEPRRGVSQRLGLDREACPGVVALHRVEPGPDPSQPQTRGRRAHRLASAGTISRRAIRPSRSAKRSVRSTWPPGKLPSRWMCTSWRSAPSASPSASAPVTWTVYW